MLTVLVTLLVLLTAKPNWSKQRIPPSPWSKHSISTTLEKGSHRLWFRTYASSAVAAFGWGTNEQRSFRKQSSNVRACGPFVNEKATALYVKEISSRSRKWLFNSHGLHINIQQRGYNFQLQQQPKPNENDIRQYESDMIVVLDMDECLIHTNFFSKEEDAEHYADRLEQKSQQGVVVDSFRKTLLNVTSKFIHVHVRPGLYDFLKRVCTRYETHIFTAAVDCYADAALDHIEAKLNENSTSGDPRTKFAGRWYWEHGTYEFKYGGDVKYLHNLWPKLQQQQNRSEEDTSRLCRTVLVDNSRLSLLANPENCILIPAFYDDPQDAELPLVWELLQELEKEPDVHPVLSEKFKTPF